MTISSKLIDSLLKEWKLLALVALLASGHTHAMFNMNNNAKAIKDVQADVDKLLEDHNRLKSNLVTVDYLNKVMELHLEHPHPGSVPRETLQFIQEAIREIKEALKDSHKD